MDPDCVENNAIGINDVNCCKRKKGIVYLASIPKSMTVVKLKETLSEYGDVGRIFLQPAKPQNKKSHRKKFSKDFTEGWVEFEKKSTAKQVALYLNNTKISSRKKSKFFDEIWNMKYLPGFKWIHLNERLAYERAVRRQRLRAEIASAKREVNYFSQNVEKSKKLFKLQKSNVHGSMGLERFSEMYPQRETEISKKNKLKKEPNIRSESDFIQNVFGT